MRRFLLIVLALPLVLAAWMFGEARSDPAVRRMAVRMPGWPAGARPVSVLLWSDIHLGNAGTGPGRLVRLVERVNALRPDLVVIAGDHLAGHGREDARAALGLAALGALRAPLGVVAVLGNHDHWTDAGAVRAALGLAGVTVLDNRAVRRGPLAVGGLDDWITRHARVGATAAAMWRIGGARLLVAHTPEVAPHLPGDVPLLLAGHTHCGQIVLPGLGPPIDVAAPRYRCGPVREGRRLTIVTAGTGTSGLPIRLRAPPDWWLLRLGP